MRRNAWWALVVCLAGCGSAGAVHRDAATPADGPTVSTDDAAPADASADVGSTPPIFPSGLSILAGVPGGVGHRDDVGSAARLNYPVAIADDGQGNLYFTDEMAATVGQVSLATGQVTTIAGSPGNYVSQDGIGSAAGFVEPEGITIDGGYLYVADGSASLIRRVELATGNVTTLAGGAPRPSDPTADMDGVGSGARFYSPEGIVADGQGNLFVADSINYTIRKVVIATAAVTTIAGKTGFIGTDDGTGDAAHFANPMGLALDGLGHLYVADKGAIRSVELASAKVTTIVSIPPSAPSSYLAGVAADGAGNLWVSDGYRATISKVDVATGTMTVLAGVTDMEGPDDGPPPAGRLFFPWMMTLGSDGALYAADRNNSAIRRVDVDTGALTTVAGEPPHPGATDGVKDAARFDDPIGVASDPAGTVFVADDGNRTVRQLVPATGAVTTLAGVPLQTGTLDGVGSAALFASPDALAADGAGNLFVVDEQSFTIRRVVIASGMVTTFAGMPGMIGGADGVGTAARFWTPEGIASDGTGHLFVTDTPNETVREIDVGSARVTSVVVGGGLSNPIGIAADGDGNLYVANSDIHTISKVVLATQEVTILAGMSGVAGATDGVGSDARFNTPMALALDSAGHLFVAEPSNHLVRKIDLATAEVSTFVGLAGEAGVKTGPLPGRLNAPAGLTVLPTGELVISDSAENVILVAH